MLYIDFHTHNIPARPDVIAVVDGRDTWGIHPWRADLSSIGKKCVPSASDSSAALRDSVAALLAIGECGLDALKGPAMEVQERVFVEQVKLSEALEKPLIIHCVKAIDRLLLLRESLKPRQSWMLHGFRGKPQQLRSLLSAGLFVSFGYHCNAESLRICPTDRLLLETDTDEQHPIEEIYNNVARVRGVEPTTLCEIMAENYRAFFQNEPLLT